MARYRSFRLQDTTVKSLHTFSIFTTLPHMYTYEGGLKSFWPSLHETWNKRPLVRESNRIPGVTATLRVWLSFFGHSPCFHGHRGQHAGKVKISRPSLQPMWNSGQAAVGLGPEQGLVSPRHTSVKHFFSQPMAPWTSAAAYNCAATHVHG